MYYTSGAIYVIFGKPTPYPAVTYANLDCSWVNQGWFDGTNGFKIQGSYNYDYIGETLAVGDINGDGIADLMFGGGAWGTNADGRSQDGLVDVVYGHAKPWAALYDTTPGGSLINGAQGFEFDGSAIGEELGNVWGNFQSLGIGDINGDGINDMIINTNAYGIFVVYGKTGTTWPQTSVLTAGTAPLDGTHGFVLTGLEGNIVVGDVNGDGYADILAWYSGNTWNSTVLIYGRPGGWGASNTVDATFLLNGVKGIEFDGAVGDNVAGEVNAFGQQSLAIGDLNGDGINDLIMGSTASSPHGSGSGSTYVYFGKPATWPTSTFPLGGL